MPNRLCCIRVTACQDLLECVAGSAGNTKEEVVLRRSFSQTPQEIIKLLKSDSSVAGLLLKQAFGRVKPVVGEPGQVYCVVEVQDHGEWRSVRTAWDSSPREPEIPLEDLSPFEIFTPIGQPYFLPH